MDKDNLLINLDEIKLGEEIGEGKNSVAYLSVISNTSDRCAIKILNDYDDEESFLKYIEILQGIKHIGIIPFYGYCISTSNKMKKNALVLKFASNISLQHILDNFSTGKQPSWWNFERQFIIIYGIAQTMNYLHNSNKIHANLTPSNILIDENNEPQITDFDQTDYFPSFDYSVENLIKYNLFYYIDPYILKTKARCMKKSDVFSFAIICIQILSGTVNIYENYSDTKQLIQDIKNGELPLIPSNIPTELKELFLSCISDSFKKRPLFKKICEKLDTFADSFPSLTEIFQEYRDKITGKNEKDDETISSEIKKLKNDALNGDERKMFLYAKARLDGDRCKKNLTEAIKFFKLAASKGNKFAKEQLISLGVEVPEETEENEENHQENSDSTLNQTETIETENIPEVEKFISLKDDNFFDQSNFDIKNILNDVKKQINDEDDFEFDTKIVEKQNFICTEGAIERLQKLHNYICVGVPVLLEGPTGTSKTLSAEIVCKLLNLELIRFNLSSETKTQDLLGRYVGDEKSWAGISLKDGPFYQAFKDGKVLLLDEINLAPGSVLQCIEEALDSGILSIEIPGRKLKKIEMNPNFRVIATQNPNKGSYAHKRQNLGLKFYSRFQNINFPSFSEDELLNIAKGLAKQFGYNNPKVILNLVQFHKEWSENPLIVDDPQCFTIREIAATVKALSQNESIYDTIMTIYGARYQNSLKNELKKELEKYPDLCSDSKEAKIPDFTHCFMNKSLKSAVKSTLFSLNNGRNVILTGKEGCGKTQVALWISEYYNSSIKSSSDEEESFFCVCTEEIKVSDLIGHQAPSGKSDGMSELIKWQDGFLTKAIKQGKCSVVESLDEAPSTVTERLNGLLDQKYDNQKQYFDIPENSANPRIPIKKTFRILGTCNIEKIAQMSPAFLNRFDIIVLENQIDESITEEELKKLISTLVNKYCIDLNGKVTKKDFKQDDSKYEDDSDSSDGIEIGSDSEPDDKEEEKEQKEEEEINFTCSPKIISLLYEKLKDEKEISRISKLCNAVAKLSYVFSSNKKISDENVVDFSFSLLKNNHQFEMPKDIENELLKRLNPIIENTDDPFFYEESPSLCNFIAKLMAYSLISQPICVSGPTGVGKTSAARTFARKRPHSSENKTGFQMHSFHSGTKVSHFFGSTTLLDGKIVFHDGTLTSALKTGLVFIADEFNLSTQSVMKSLSLALDPTIGKNVFIPGIGQIINISPEFHFIACQNEIGTLGRNAIPDSIASRFVYIDYPKPEKDDIEKICIDISKEIFNYNKKSFREEEKKLARCIANYMILLNDKKISYIPQWSLRDITKLFRRIYLQKSFDNKKNFINITAIHHVLFYTMSAVSSTDVDIVINEVRSILMQAFNLSDDEVNKYIDCYKAIPEIREIEGQGYYIMKGENSGISINGIDDKLIDKTLPSLWNSIFQVKLSGNNEPILLMGNSGFKTFLSKQFLSKAKIISLNQETNVAQLLGASGFMTKTEAKLFYISYICKILQSEFKTNELKEMWEKGELTMKKLKNIIEDGKKHDIPVSFDYALTHLSEKLLNDENDNKDSILSNTTLEFRPGLFLNAILEGQSLILKDLSNLPTIVLERFNELFSGKQNITLSEDIHNTFTPPDYKELTSFNLNFRVFATCPANSHSRLSEAVLSRFTVISVPEYSSDEQEVVLKSYIQLKKLQFELEDITKLSTFAKSCSSELKISIPFPQIFKVVEIVSKINQEISKIKHDMDMNTNRIIIGITLYRVLGGILDSKKKKKALFNQIKGHFDIPEFYLNKKADECQLSVTSENGVLGVSSNISNLFLKCSVAHECKTKVAFTGSFNDLLDLLHLGLTIHNPIILEGPPGQGKHTAINYIADMLNINIVNIMISQSTKVEDLFGKDVISRQKDGIHVEMVETQFVKIIKSADDFDKRSLIILENINNSSPALLNALAPVFDSNSSSILLPNGSTIEKGKFDIIGIFNTQQSYSSKDKFPSSLINSSIYHIVSRSNEKEILNIILTKFSLAGLSNEEAIKFNNYYKQAQKITLTEGSSELFTLNDIEKYILFRNLTKNLFHETTIAQMVFAYRFSSDEMIQKMLKELNLENLTFNPIFNYNIPPTHLLVRISNEATNDLTLPLFSRPKKSSILSKLDSLTLPQKHCLIFLACSLLSKRSCVIQGDTASGKSYLVRLFAELLGAKLHVFQMNSDSNISMLAGQSILRDSISESDEEKFKKAFNDLQVNEKIKKYIKSGKNINVDDPKSWNPKILKNLLNYIESIDSEIKKTKDYPKIQESIQLIKETMNPVNRFEHQESIFINAILKGEWVLIDGIESAPSFIAEKISSLCGDNPQLNLFEYGPDYFFSKDDKAPPKNRIHDNFHLFITYNPNSMKESQMIDQTFFVKSVTFTLPPIDERIENSAQMLLGSFTNFSYPKDISKEIAARFALMHKFAKKKSQKNPDDFAGDIQFNGRTLKFITKQFSLLKDKNTKSILRNLPRSICYSIKLFYWNSFIDSNKLKVFQADCLSKFTKKPQDDLIITLQSGDISLRERNKQILLILRNIQNYVLGISTECSYSLHNLLDFSSLIRISDLPFIQTHLLDTIKIIEENTNISFDDDNLLAKFGSLHALSSLFEFIIHPETPIIKEHTFLSLKDEQLKNDKSITADLLRFDLLKDLMKENVFSETSSFMAGRKIFSDLLSHIILISENCTKSLISSLFEKIHLDENLIQFVDLIFPYQKFKDSAFSMISYLIPLCKILFTKEITFSFIIDDKTIKFNESIKSDFQVEVVMNQENNLSLNTGSAKYKNRRCFKINEHPEENNEQYNFIFYSLVLKLLHNQTNADDKDFIVAQKKQCKKEWKNGNISPRSSDSLFSIKDLFASRDDKLIGNIWNIVYTLSMKDIAELSKLIHPFESKMLTAVTNMFRYINQFIYIDIIQWSKWASNFDNHLKSLLDLSLNNDSFKSLTDDEKIELIKDTIQYLSNSPQKMNDFWSSKELIDICQFELNKLTEARIQNEIDKKKIEIKNKIDKLITYLTNQTVQPKYKIMKTELINNLGGITDFTPEKFNCAKKIVEQFLKQANSQYEDYKGGNQIIWPYITFKDYIKGGLTENIKLFEVMIWYSRILEILIEINKGNDLMKNLWKLNDFKEMNSTRQILFSHLIKNAKKNRSGLTIKDKKQALHTLNSHMIMNLYNINSSFISDPERFVKAVNKYSNRNLVDEREVLWINKNLSEYSPDFNLLIPRFEPNDLVFLIINNESESNYQYGPLLSSRSTLLMLDDFEDLLSHDFENFSDAAKSIGKIAYIQLISTDGNAPSNYEQLKRSFYHPDISGSDKFAKMEIIRKIQKIFEFADSLEKWNDQQFLFDDIKFLSGDWINDTEILNKYPSLLFWICKNRQCSDQLINLYHKFTPKPNEIPFWLLALRILSSNECICFDNKSNITILSEIIKDVTSTGVNSYLRLMSGKELNYDWLNILLSNLPTKFVNPFISIVHNFFLNLSMDDKEVYPTLINNLKNKYIRDSITNITSLLLSNKSEEMMIEDINKSDDQAIQFLAFPSKFIQGKINGSSGNIAKSILNDDSITNLRKYLSSADLNSLIPNLQNAIDEDQKNMKINFEKKFNQDKEERKERKIRYIKSCADQYNDILTEICTCKIKHKDLNQKVLSLQQINEKLQPYHDIFITEVVKLMCIKYHSFKDFKIDIIRRDQPKRMTLPQSYNGIQYLRPDEKFDKKATRGKDYYLLVDFATNVEFHYLNKDFDYNVVGAEFSYEIIYPKMTFGISTTEYFIQNIRKLIDSLNSIEVNFINDLETPSRITKSTFDYVSDINNLIYQIKSNFRVQFSDHSPTTNTTYFLQRELSHYLDYICPLMMKINDILQKNLYPLWKVLNSNTTFYTLFKYSYDIQIPEIESTKKTPDFSNIRNINSLSSPIISILPDNKIICSVNKLKCQIGPIFPTSIYDPYSINIISFIEDDVFYRIDNLSDPKFKKILSTKERVNKKEPIQIFVKPPCPSKNEPEIIKMEGDIIIEKESIEPYSLPFQITLGIVPIKVRIRCLEYKLAEQNKNIRLCCDKINSGSSINFEVINYYISDHFLLSVELDSFDDNEINKPEIKIQKEKHQFSLNFPDVKEPTRGKFIIKIALSQKIVVSVMCDLIVIPIVRSFEVYDYMTKEYTSNCKLLYNSDQSYSLYFRILTQFPYKQECKIIPYLPSSVQISIDDKLITSSFPHKLEVEKDLFFMMKIHFDPLRNRTSFPSSYSSYYIALEIGSIKTKINITFVSPFSYSFNPYEHGYSTENNRFLASFPCCKYNHKTKKWNMITCNDDLMKNYTPDLPYFICTPFNSYTNYLKFPIINYTYDDYVKSTNSKNIIYLQITRTTKQNLLTNTESSAKKEHKFLRNLIYYSVLGYIKDNDNIWFPVFNKYPDLKGIDLLPYSSDDINKRKASENITKMQKRLDVFDLITSKKDQLGKYFTHNTSKFIDQTNFGIFMLSINQPIILEDPMKFISIFPKEIQEQFSDFKGDFDGDFTEELQGIVLHNLIVKFVQIFSKKYKELESHMFCLQCPLKNNDLKSYELKMQALFFKYDKSKESKRSLDTELLFKRNEDALSKISIEEIPDKSEHQECFIISENEPPKPCELKEKLGSFEFDEKDKEESIIMNTMESFASLPKIELPSTYSISSLSSFYSTCSQGSTVLPAYILYTQIQKKDQEYSQQYFSVLLSIYQKITRISSVDRSILATHANSFIESFQNCVRRLRRAGVDFNKINIPSSLLNTKNNLQDFIKSPTIENPLLAKTKWKYKSYAPETTTTRYRDPLYKNGRFGIYEGEEIEKLDMMFKYPETNPEESTAPKEEPIINTEIGKEEKNFLIAQVIGEDKMDDEDEDDDNNIFNNDETIEPESKPKLKVVDESSMKTVNAKNEDINGMFPKFSEIDSIERVLRRIKQMKMDDKLKFLDATECVIQNQNEMFRTAETKFPVQQLIDHSQNLIANLIAKASDIEFPILFMSCNLLIDCSSFISHQNKLYNFMLVVAFSYALSALEIPFSISIVADKNFRFVLKPFDEEISFLVLQRILDCLFISRYKTNLADTVYHSIKFMKCPDNKRTQRAIFLFSNGLDENLVLSQSWKETLLNDPNNSFGLIFVKSQLFDEEKYSSIQSMWDNFNDVAKTASSITKLISINPDLNPKTFDIIATTFATVLTRPGYESNSELMNKNDLKPEFISSYNELSKESFDIVKEAFNCSFDDVSKSIFRNINNQFTATGSRFQKLDVAYYRNKIDKITLSSPNYSIKDEYDQFIHKLVYYKSRLYRPYLEAIFKPNKASQTVLSSTGTDFDITALILNLLNPVPDPLIYLEEKGGLIRNYGITIIIDSSKSCFNPLSSSHSYQTIKTLFSSLASIDVSCVDVIVATNDSPIVLSSEIPSSRLFSDKSSIWSSLFVCLSDACSDYCNLESAIHAAYDIRRLRSVDSTSYLFILTDGLFQEEQKNLVKNHVMSCMQSGMLVFGIGIGIYPIGIVDLFPQTIFTTNPNDLIRGIASLFGNEPNDAFCESIKHLAPEQSSSEVIGRIFENLIKKENDPVFKDLKNYLSDVRHSLDAFSDMYNEEREARNSNNELINPEGENTEMFVKDLLKGQKILVIMIYEDGHHKPQYLNVPVNAGETCVKDAVGFYGIELVIVTNYESAIRELTKQSIPGKCDYYALWIISGAQDGTLSNGANLSYAPNFIECAIQFWNNGGSVVLWADNSPFTYEANLFLEKVVFPDGTRTGLRVNGDNPGGQHLEGDPSGLLNRPRTFNKSPIEFKKFNRSSLAHNLYDIFEGITLAFANSSIAPFTPFMRDSSGGISCLYYTGDRDPKHRTGDLVVDCGWTKLFWNMTESGTYRYIQNLAGWTAQCEYNRVNGVDPKNARPKAVIYSF